MTQPPDADWPRVGPAVAAYFGGPAIAPRLRLVAVDVNESEGSAGHRIDIAYVSERSPLVRHRVIDPAEEWVESFDYPRWPDALAAEIVEGIYEDTFALPS